MRRFYRPVILPASTSKPTLTAVDSDYRARDAVLAAIEATRRSLLQDDVIDIDAQRTGGLLELRFPERQQDRRQHAAAACTSSGWRRTPGGFHFKLVGRALDRQRATAASSSPCCRRCASEQAGKALRFEP